MAELSNQLMALTVLAYLAAMVCYAGEYAFGRRSHIGRAALVGAGAPVPELEKAPERDRGELVGRIGVALNLIALALHLATTVTRGVAAERMPWGNMYEYILSTALIGSAVWAGVLLRKPAVRHLGLFASLTLVVLLGAAALVAYTPVGPLVPALNSYWYVFHVSTIIISSGIFLVGVVPAAMFLIKNGWDTGKRGFPYTLGKRVGDAGTLERLTFRLHAFAFPLFTFGALIAGPLWAEASWGRYWGWDPKEVWAFISWIVYAAYLHARATPSVKRTTATWIAVIGFVTMLMNLFGVNLFFEGLHSYA
ncbi:cytochrome c-type biogenesis protein CcsB [Actinoplanes campanulatus]|uniref:Cytochrome c-type biogenesis protein CcsB n=1 Tax=Actinoplanes campanulatus TaxID=113559 RepID=A0A7W5APB1_9ACTN|nr:c-type cytochrome biogenesis protein CcsB [Actinoplanes campanulatus]MBB3099883.1 cytochrome c-type biogenesis protein CcsB [Actinoplanes campanulatus]GGN47999.1 c-type cytochrome biogenesis protein CcsB [Actinoplanes campanulatus]GID40443.1 c-type cytochrome biogenesis protein CcsB [Actinoplanes campanulatus]